MVITLITVMCIHTRTNGHQYDAQLLYSVHQNTHSFEISRCFLIKLHGVLEY